MRAALPKPMPAAIKAAREKGGDTMGEAAERVHVTRGAWSRWESGERPMPLAAWELYLIKRGMR